MMCAIWYKVTKSELAAAFRKGPICVLVWAVFVACLDLFFYVCVGAWVSATWKLSTFLGKYTWNSKILGSDFRKNETMYINITGLIILLKQIIFLFDHKARECLKSWGNPRNRWTNPLFTAQNSMAVPPTHLLADSLLIHTICKLWTWSHLGCRVNAHLLTWLSFNV